MTETFCLCRLPSDGLVMLLLLVYSPIGLCLMLLRIFIGVHVFLVSCALPDSFIRRYVQKHKQFLIITIKNTVMGYI